MFRKLEDLKAASWKIFFRFIHLILFAFFDVFHKNTHFSMFFPGYSKCILSEHWSYQIWKPGWCICFICWSLCYIIFYGLFMYFFSPMCCTSIKSYCTYKTISIITGLLFQFFFLISMLRNEYTIYTLLIPAIPTC